VEAEELEEEWKTLTMVCFFDPLDGRQMKEVESELGAVEVVM